MRNPGIIDENKTLCKMRLDFNILFRFRFDLVFFIAVGVVVVGVVFIVK